MTENQSGANTHGRNEDGIWPNAGIAYQRMAIDNGAGEFDWGSGLVPKGLEDAPPSEGGMYRGTSPRCAKVISVRNRSSRLATG